MARRKKTAPEEDLRAYLWQRETRSLWFLPPLLRRRVYEERAWRLGSVALGLPTEPSHAPQSSILELFVWPTEEEVDPEVLAQSSLISRHGFDFLSRRSAYRLQARFGKERALQLLIELSDHRKEVFSQLEDSSLQRVLSGRIGSLTEGYLVHRASRTWRAEVFGEALSILEENPDLDLSYLPFLLNRFGTLERVFNLPPAP